MSEAKPTEKKKKSWKSLVMAISVIVLIVAIGRLAKSGFTWPSLTFGTSPTIENTTMEVTLTHAPSEVVTLDRSVVWHMETVPASAVLEVWPDGDRSSAIRLFYPTDLPPSWNRMRFRLPEDQQFTSAKLTIKRKM